MDVKKYRPLLVVLGLALAGATALQFRNRAGFELMAFMTTFMGLFLLSFATLKLFDLGGFAKGFEKYDLLAAKIPVYARIYPFLELALALLYLSGWFLSFAFCATILLMGFGLLGIVQSMRRGENLQCACMGSFLDVPLSVVSLAENAGMAGMAILMLAL